MTTSDEWNIVWDKVVEHIVVWEPSFLVCLTQKVAEVWKMCVLEKYLQNIVREGVEVSRGSKALNMRDVQGYPLAPETVHF